jgi:PAS domain S-box-containing protein
MEVAMPRTVQKLNQRIRETEESLRRETQKRKAAEEALQITRDTFKRAMKKMPVIIFATDDDGSVVFFNREFERVSGYSAADIVDNSEILKLLFPTPDNTFKSDSKPKAEWRFHSKDGSEKIVVWSNISKYFPIPGWKSWRVGVDITDLKTSLARVKILSGLLPICAQSTKNKLTNSSHIILNHILVIVSALNALNCCILDMAKIKNSITQNPFQPLCRKL